MGCPSVRRPNSEAVKIRSPSGPASATGMKSAITGLPNSNQPKLLVATDWKFVSNPVVGNQPLPKPSPPLTRVTLVPT